jgi:hypothetical protein
MADSASERVIRSPSSGAISSYTISVKSVIVGITWMIVLKIDCAEVGVVLLGNVLRSSLIGGEFCWDIPGAFGWVGTKCIFRDVV